jgi:hypothetical protein
MAFGLSRNTRVAFLLAAASFATAAPACVGDELSGPGGSDAGVARSAGAFTDMAVMRSPSVWLNGVATGTQATLAAKVR